MGKDLITPQSSTCEVNTARLYKSFLTRLTLTVLNHSSSQTLQVIGILLEVWTRSLTGIFEMRKYEWLVQGNASNIFNKNKTVCAI